MTIEDLRAAAAIVKGKKISDRLDYAHIVPGSGLVKAQAEAEGLEEVLVDDVGARGDHRVDHVVLDHQRHGVLQTGREQAAGQGQDDAAVPVAQHGVDDVGRRGEVPGLEGHVPAGPDEGTGVEGGGIDVADHVLEQVVLVHVQSFSLSRPM